jgi:hypothetical protein
MRGRTRRMRISFLLYMNPPSFVSKLHLCSLGCGDLLLTFECFSLPFLANAPSTQTAKAPSKGKVASAGKEKALSNPKQ